MKTAVSPWWWLLRLGHAGALILLAIAARETPPFAALAMLVAGAVCSAAHGLLLRQCADRLRTDGGLLRWIRHPMYLGDLVQLIALLAASGELAGPMLLLVLPASLAVFMLSAHEDRAMARTHPAEWAPWSARTWRLIPGLL